MSEKTKVSKAIIDSLTSGCKEFAKADIALDKSHAVRDTMTDKVLIPAIECGDLETWDAARAELDRLARKATKTARKAMGYQQVEREDKGGNKTLVTVPKQALADIFSVVRQTYVRSLSFTDGRGERVSFDALKKQKKAHQDKINKKAKGRKADVMRLTEVFKTIKARGKNLNDEDYHNLVNRLDTEAKALPTSKGKAA